MISYDMLFSPITINQMELSNRVIMAPTVDHLASEDGFVTPRQKDFILKRAKGGISMIVVGGIAVNPRNYPFVLRIHDDKYLPGLRDLCDRKGILLILDEVQTGIGRTGKLFIFQFYDMKPDIISIAKSLGGGIPIGAMLAIN